MNLRYLYTGISLVIYLAFFPVVASSQTAQDKCVGAPELEMRDTNVVTVENVRQLNKAVRTVNRNTTIVLKPGEYRLTETLVIRTDNLTIRGLETRCDKVVLVGRGMDELNHKGLTSAFWIAARNATVANMTIRDIYNHPIQINGKSESPWIYNVRMINAGQQFVKSNPKPDGVGASNGIVEYSVMEYTDGTPKTNHHGSGFGYGNGVDIHGGRGWQIRRNRFLNTHTPDGSDHEWNAAILAWRGSSDTVAENNLFINVDRAIAFGLSDKGSESDHRGGVIRNNLIVMSPTLYSVPRRWRADAPIIIWDSPGTRVLHNSILTNGNTPFSIEARFDDTDILIRNNLADAPIVYSPDKINREACKFTMICKDYLSTYANTNETDATAAWFMRSNIGDLRLHENALPLTRTVPLHPEASHDHIGRNRPPNATPGAFQSNR